MGNFTVNTESNLASASLGETRLRVPLLPVGAQWYLVLYRWFLVAAGIYTIWSTWNVWQFRDGPRFEYSPMLPVWEGMPQFDFGYPLIGALLLILLLPRTGMTLLSAMLIFSVLCDQMRLQPHYQIVFLLWGTLPGVNAQFFGRMSLITIWFWVGFHKLIIDFIKPDGMAGFTTDIIPGDLMKFFPPDKNVWNTPLLGNVVGWMIGVTEISLALFCIIPRTRWFAAIGALLVHSAILWWNCWQWGCNLIGFNAALALAGFVLIVPWKEWPWVSWQKCNWPMRIGTVLLFLSPAAFYVNGICGYLAYCVYVPNSPFAMLYRPGEDPKFAPMLPVGGPDATDGGRWREINFPLPPSHSIAREWFDKIRKPGDVLIIHDPRPWGEAHGMNGYQITDFGDFPRGVHWKHWHEQNGALAAEGDTVDGIQQGLWLSWHKNGKLHEQGVFVNGEEEGLWISWYDNGQKEWERHYKNGILQGTSTSWYSDGRKEMEGKYLNGEMQGEWTKWSEDGQKVQWNASETPQ